jgi:hypothetical protein
MSTTNNTITDPLFLTLTAIVDRADYRAFLDGMRAVDVKDCFGARLTEVYGDSGAVLSTVNVESVLVTEYHDRHDSWEVDEELEYNPMNALGVAGFVYKWDVDECDMVFSRGEGEDERHMLGHPFSGGVNLMLHDSFYNYTLIQDHATAESFVEAFTAKWEELVSEHYDED